MHGRSHNWDKMDQEQTWDDVFLGNESNNRNLSTRFPGLQDVEAGFPEYDNYEASLRWGFVRKVGKGSLEASGDGGWSAE